MVNMNYIDYSLIFRALGDPTRLEIIELLSKNKLCACNILEKFRITQPTLSHHMKKLSEAGLIICEKEGKWTHYQLNSVVIDKISEFFVFNKDKSALDSMCGEKHGSC